MSLCPFCKSELNPGATACHCCGAYKTIKLNTWGRPPFFLMVFLVIPVALTFQKSYYRITSEDMLFSAVCIGLIILIFKMGGKSTWIRRG